LEVDFALGNGATVATVWVVSATRCSPAAVANGVLILILPSLPVTAPAPLHAKCRLAVVEVLAEAPEPRQLQTFLALLQF
jgi:hypothetical protein